MNFKEFFFLTEAAVVADYKVINRPKSRLGLGYIPLDVKQAQEAEIKFKAGRIGLMPFLKKQEVGFRAIIDGKEYLRSMDGIFLKNLYPIDGYKGTAIGQRELYSPYALKKYTAFLKKNPTSDTDPITVEGGPNNYKVRDGHHRMEAYIRAGRTEVPVWVEKTR